MKILFTNKKQRAYVKSVPTFNILNALKSKIDVEDLHILTDDGNPTNEFNIDPLKYNYKFFEDYKTDNILEILEKEKPDVLVSTNDYEYLGRAFVLAAKQMKIPTVLLFQGIFADIYMTRSDHLLIRDRYVILKKRGRFILKKFWQLLKNYRFLNYNPFIIFKLIIDDLITPFLYSEPAGKYGCELILVRNQTDKEVFQKRGIKSKIVITGDPGLDSIYRDISKFPIKHELNKSRIKVVLLTTAMVEHGLWTEKMWEETMTKVVSSICSQYSKEIDFEIKIHPTSERIQDYKRLLKKLGYPVPIYQTEDLMEVVSHGDIILTMEGGSWANWVAVLLKKPLIIVNVVNDPETKKFAYIKENIAYELRDMNDLGKIIQKIKSEKFDERKVNNFILKQHYKFDGKSGERSADAILEMVKNYKILNK